MLSKSGVDVILCVLVSGPLYVYVCGRRKRAGLQWRRVREVECTCYVIRGMLASALDLTFLVLWHSGWHSAMRPATGSAAGAW